MGRFLDISSFRAEAGNSRVSWSPCAVTGLQEGELFPPGSRQSPQFRPPPFVGQKPRLFLGLARAPQASPGGSAHAVLSSYLAILALGFPSPAPFLLPPSRPSFLSPCLAFTFKLMFIVSCPALVAAVSERGAWCTARSRRSRLCSNLPHPPRGPSSLCVSGGLRGTPDTAQGPSRGRKKIQFIFVRFLSDEGQGMETQGGGRGSKTHAFNEHRLPTVCKTLYWHLAYLLVSSYLILITTFERLRNGK